MPEEKVSPKKSPAGPPRVGALVVVAVLALAALALDQFTKYLVVSTLPLGEQVKVLGDLLILQFVKNPGAAFSLAAGSTWIFSILATVVTVAIIVLARRIRSIGWAVVFGLLLGLVLALMRLSPVAPYRWIATVFIEFFRGVPALIVFVAFQYGIPIAFPGYVIPGGTFGTVTVALGLVGAAYMAETIRAGIQAVPKGQIEAARSLGMPAGTATRKIVLPQAFRIITPPLTNEVILLVKDSSLVYVLGLSISGYELTKYGRDLASNSSSLTPLVVAGLCYLIITLPLSIIVRRMEARQKKER